jgi:formaldehyde-activating enzyme involved in methanogenesis
MNLKLEKKIELIQVVNVKIESEEHKVIHKQMRDKFKLEIKRAMEEVNKRENIYDSG